MSNTGRVSRYPEVTKMVMDIILPNWKYRKFVITDSLEISSIVSDATLEQIGNKLGIELSKGEKLGPIVEELAKILNLSC